MNTLMEMTFLEKFCFYYFLAGIFFALIFEIIIFVLKMIKRTKRVTYSFFPFEVPIMVRLSFLFLWPYMIYLFINTIKMIDKIDQEVKNEIDKIKSRLRLEGIAKKLEARSFK